MNIFVAKLNPMTLSKDVQKAFEAFGVVNSADVIMDIYSGRSKCFGFIEMPDAGEATQAIHALHESDLDGYIIQVKEADPRDPRSSKGFGRGIRFGDTNRTRF